MMGAGGSRRRFILIVSLCVDAALLVMLGDAASSWSAAMLGAAFFAVAAVLAGVLAGWEAALTVGLFTGTLFVCFMTPLHTGGQIAVAAVAIGGWNASGVLASLLGARIGVAGGRRTAPPARHSVVLSLADDNAAELRVALRGLLASRGIDHDAADDVVLATQEAYNNAVVHDPGEARVTVSVASGLVIVEVTDRGPGFAADGRRWDLAPDPSRPCGRGLYLMHRLMDAVTIESGDTGTRVVLEKLCRAATMDPGLGEAEAAVRVTSPF